MSSSFGTPHLFDTQNGLISIQVLTTGGDTVVRMSYPDGHYQDLTPEQVAQLRGVLATGIQAANTLADSGADRDKIRIRIAGSDT